MEASFDGGVSAMRVPGMPAGVHGTGRRRGRDGGMDDRGHHDDVRLGMSARTRRSIAAFTVVEVLVAFSIFSLIVVTVFSFLSRVFNPDRPSAVRMTGASVIRQEGRLAFQKLMWRLEEGIEVVEPAPGRSAPDLVFQDLLNHRIRIALDERGDLVTYRLTARGAELESTPATIQCDSGEAYAPTRPVRIQACKKALFQVLSPTLVTIFLTMVEGNQSQTLVATVRLKNSRLAD